MPLHCGRERRQCNVNEGDSDILFCIVLFVGLENRNKNVCLFLGIYLQILKLFENDK